MFIVKLFAHFTLLNLWTWVVKPEVIIFHMLDNC